jgi:hypothetical protein
MKELSSYPVTSALVAGASDFVTLNTAYYNGAIVGNKGGLEIPFTDIAGAWLDRPVIQVRFYTSERLEGFKPPVNQVNAAAFLLNLRDTDGRFVLSDMPISRLSELRFGGVNVVRNLVLEPVRIDWRRSYIVCTNPAGIDGWLPFSVYYL